MEVGGLKGKACVCFFSKSISQLLKKKKNQSKNRIQSWQCVTQGRRAHSVTAPFLSRGGDRVIQGEFTLYLRYNLL